MKARQGAVLDQVQPAPSFGASLLPESEKLFAVGHFWPVLARVAREQIEEHMAVARRYSDDPSHTLESWRNGLDLFLVLLLPHLQTPCLDFYHHDYPPLHDLFPGDELGRVAQILEFDGYLAGALELLADSRFNWQEGEWERYLEELRSREFGRRLLNFKVGWQYVIGA